jgi:hypothetical protein
MHSSNGTFFSAQGMIDLHYVLVVPNLFKFLLAKKPNKLAAVISIRFCLNDKSTLKGTL